MMARKQFRLGRTKIMKELGGGPRWMIWRLRPKGGAYRQDTWIGRAWLNPFRQLGLLKEKK